MNMCQTRSLLCLLVIISFTTIAHVAALDIPGASLFIGRGDKAQEGNVEEPYIEDAQDANVNVAVDPGSAAGAATSAGTPGTAADMPTGRGGGADRGTGADRGAMTDRRGGGGGGAMQRSRGGRGDVARGGRGGGGALTVPGGMFDPFTRMDSIVRDMENTMNALTRSFGFPLLATDDTLLPAFTADMPTMAVDVREENNKFIVQADMPGVDRGAVRVRVTPDRVLEIEGERRNEREEDDPDQRVHRVEREVGIFRRRFQLPDNVDPTRITAKLDNGVLRIEVPKTDKGDEGHHDVPVH